MNQGVVVILNQIRAAKGERVFSDGVLFGALFADFAKGAFKGEFHLMSLAFSTGLYQELKENPENFADIRRRYRIRMDSEYCWTAEQVDFAVSCCLTLLGRPEAAEDGGELRRLKRAAQQGDAQACYSLGLAYEMADGVAQDCEKAAVWFQKAAGQGFADAQHKLALCYYSGRGVPQDYTQAEYWWIQAAQRGHAVAQFNLGIRYSHG